MTQTGRRLARLAGDAVAAVRAGACLILRCAPNPDPWGRQLATLAADPFLAALPLGAGTVSVCKKKASRGRSLPRLLAIWFGGWNGPGVTVTFATTQSEPAVCAFFEVRAAGSGWTLHGPLAQPCYWGKTIAGNHDATAFLYRWSSEDDSSSNITTWKVGASSW